MDEQLEDKKEELAKDSPIPAPEEMEADPTASASVDSDAEDSISDEEAVGDTQPAEAMGEGSAPIEEPTPQSTETEPGQEKMIPQSQVNELIGKTRMEARKKAQEEYANELRAKYGVESDDELDTMFGDGQRYSALNDEYGIAQKTITDLQTENALLKSGVPTEKWEDVKAIMAYQHLQVTPETIASMLPSHPEWSGSQAKTIDTATSGKEGFPQVPKQAEEKPSVIQRLGGEPSPVPEESTEEAEKRKAFEAMGIQ